MFSYNDRASEMEVRAARVVLSYLGALSHTYNLNGYNLNKTQHSIP